MKSQILQEQIKKSLRLMGVLNEATVPTSLFNKIFPKIFGGVVGQNLDLFFTQLSQELPGVNLAKSLKGIQSLISKQAISKKRILEILFQNLGKSDDEIVNLIIDASPDTYNILKTAAKTESDILSIKGKVPGLADLPDDIVDELLKRAGVVVGTKVTIEEATRALMAEFPILMKKNFLGIMENKEIFDSCVQKISNLKLTNKNIEAMKYNMRELVKESANLAKKGGDFAEVASTSKGLASQLNNFLNPFVKDGKLDWNLKAIASWIFLSWVWHWVYNIRKGQDPGAAAVTTTVRMGKDGAEAGLNELMPMDDQQDPNQPTPIKPGGNDKVKAKKGELD
jgi:hypothetical protein